MLCDADRTVYYAETKSGHRDWQYNQHIGNQLACESFRQWAIGEGWIEVAN
jgi:hypothetical protein